MSHSRWRGLGRARIPRLGEASPACNPTDPSLDPPTVTATHVQSVTRRGTRSCKQSPDVETSDDDGLDRRRKSVDMRRWITWGHAIADVEANVENLKEQRTVADARSSCTPMVVTSITSAWPMWTPSLRVVRNDALRLMFTLPISTPRSGRRSNPCCGSPEVMTTAWEHQRKHGGLMAPMSSRPNSNDSTIKPSMPSTRCAGLSTGVPERCSSLSRAVETSRSSRGEDRELGRAPTSSGIPEAEMEGWKTVSERLSRFGQHVVRQSAEAQLRGETKATSQDRRPNRDHPGQVIIKLAIPLLTNSDLTPMGFHAAEAGNRSVKVVRRG